MVGYGTAIAAASPILPSPEELSLAQLAAQMVVVRTTGHLFDHEIRYPAWEADQATLEHYIQGLGIGGVILLGGSAAEVGIKTQQMQSQASIPLLIAADIEEGVGQRFSGATWFPPPMALDAVAQRDLSGAKNYAYTMGQVTAQEARAIGINWLLAPVVDINNNPENPVINVRAFGQSVDGVSTLTQAYIRGARECGVLTTAKHFPGHGDTDLDSHLELPVLSHSLERLRRVEWVPFRGAIAAEVDAIMTAHLKVPSLDSLHPATLSAPTLTGILRQDFQFTGLIVTDALVMGAITKTYGPYEAAVLATEAGADLLLMPADPEGTIRALVEAVNTNRLSRKRLMDSVERIWRAKQRVASLLTVPPESCHAWEHVPPPAVDVSLLGQSPSRQAAANILQSSTEIRVTVQPCTSGDNIILVDDIIDCPFLSPTAPAIVWPTSLNYHPRLIDQRGCHHQPDPNQLQPSLVQLFIRGNPFRGSAASTSLANAWIQALLSAGMLQGLIIYGSPYVKDSIPELLPAELPFAFTYGQMPEAQSHVLRQFLDLSAAPAVQPLSAFTD
jgi:beta-glucosidase